MKIFVRVTDDNNKSYEGTMELTKSTKRSSLKKTQIQIKGPTDVIRVLYFQNYFESSKTLHDVEQKIKSKKFNFDIRTIENALKRAKYLKREGTGHSHSYIQKIPPQ